MGVLDQALAEAHADAESQENELDVLDERMAVDADLGAIVRHPTRFLGIEPASTPLDPQTFRIRIQGLSDVLRFEGSLADVVEEASIALRELDAYGAGPAVVGARR
jgi:hypothetical protein